MTPFGWKWLAVLLLAIAACVLLRGFVMQFDGIGSVHLFGK